MLQANVQSQVSPRWPPPGWPNWIRKEIPSQNKDKPDRMSESNHALNDNENPRSSEASLEPAEKTLMNSQLVAQKQFHKRILIN